MDDMTRALTPAAAPPFAAFTICSRNFLAQAQLLHRELRRHHPDVRFRVALCDEPAGFDIAALPFEVLSIYELGIPRLAGMIERYNITELNTALKPFAFLHLFDRYPGTPVVYFDPDIMIVSPLAELEEILLGGADCVLTPHLCEPAEFAEMNERRMLQFGIYNLGFCALRGTPEVRRIVAWWGRRLEAECVIDLASGLFVDQKWADLLPGFIGGAVILRHPGYNAAYWNLSQRTVRLTRQGGEQRWLVNGQPLRFFHFSGSVVDEPATFSRHSGQFRLEALRDVALLFDAYCSEVRSLGRDDYRSIPYAFHWNGAHGAENPHTPIASGGAAGSASTAPRPLGPGTRPPYLPLLRADSLPDLLAARATEAGNIARRRDFEAALIPRDDLSTFHVPGMCVVCGAERRFQVGFMYAADVLPDGRLVPNWREHLDCPVCGYVNRLRAVLHVLFQEIRPEPDARIYITEQLMPIHGWLKERFASVTGSEYIDAGRAPGEIVDGVRHEDVQNLSFADASFDLILSFDVLEHVPDEKRAFAELSRCLRPGGALMFTAPFREHLQEHETRAVLLDDGTVRHLMEPEYHGNPVDMEKGSLCFRYYGWRLMDDLRAAGLEAPEGLFFWSSRFAYLGDTNSVFIARKPRGAQA